MNVDREIDALYTGPPEAFVAARDDLAKRLKSADRAEDSAAVKALRRPTVAAWAINRLAHERPGSLEPLMELAADLRKAQRGALSGLRGAALREAVKRRRAVVDRIADEAIGFLEASGRSGEGQREAVTRTLEAATADQAAADAVRAGRLEKELQRPTGFGELTGLAPVPDAGGGDQARPAKRRPGRARASKPAPPREDPKLRRLRVQRDDAADGARSAARAAVRAGERAVRASREAEAATVEVDRMERDLRAARRRERDSSQSAAQAATAAKRAEAEAERARKKVEDLQGRIERLLDG